MNGTWILFPACPWPELYLARFLVAADDTTTHVAGLVVSGNPQRDNITADRLERGQDNLLIAFRIGKYSVLTTTWHNAQVVTH